MDEQTKVFAVDADNKTLTQKVTEAKPLVDRPLFQRTKANRFMTLREAAATTSQFPVLLQDGLKAILFDSYAGFPTTFQDFCQMVASDKPDEVYLEANTIGTLPIVPELGAYPEIEVDLDRTLQVKNSKYGSIFAVSREMIMYDRVGIIKQYPADLGAAAKMTQEQAVYSAMCTTGNYTRTTADNDIGNNTGATTFSAAGLATAYATLRTMRDRKSGRPLGVLPDTLIVAPGLEWVAKQLLVGDALWRASAYTTAEVYGTTNFNAIKGTIKNLIVSPYIGTKYGWVLLQSKRLMVFQEVEPLTMLVQDNDSHQDSEGYFVYDKIRYRVSCIFGTGVINDRFGYYSNSTTAGAVG